MGVVTTLVKPKRMKRSLIWAPFNAPDETDLADYVPEINVEGGGFTIVGGSWSLAGGLCSPDVAAGKKLAYIDGGKRNVELTTVFRAGSTFCPGLLIRYTDNTHYFVIQPHLADQKIKLIEDNDGYAVLGEVNFDIVEDTMYYLRIKVSGNSIKLFFDSVDVISVASDHNNLSTIYGLWADTPGAGPGSIDDFELNLVED